MASDLQDAFREWVQSLVIKTDQKDWENDDFFYPDRVYAKAVQATKILSVSVAQIHNLLRQQANDPFVGQRRSWALGMFASAAYARCKEEVIVYDLELPMTHLAHKLPPDKVFVNQKSLGRSIGTDAEGLLINYGTVDESFGFNSYALINYGKTGQHTANEFRITHHNERKPPNLAFNLGMTGDGFGAASTGAIFNFHRTGCYFGDGSSGLLVNDGTAGHSAGMCSEGRLLFLKKAESYCHDIAPDVWSPKVFFPDDCKNISGLQAYVDYFRSQLEKGRTDVEATIAVMRPLSKETIEREIGLLVTAAGREW